MKVGDLVKIEKTDHAGIVLDIIQKKCWRTSERGVGVDWNKVEPELHAVVLFDNRKVSIPVVDLEVVNEVG
jgi:hypothetical protein